jgi:CBS domain-containing protein
MPRSISLDSYMVKRPVKVKANATILEAVEVILRHSVSGLCVVDDNDDLVGMLSELDCLRAIVERIYVNKQASAGYVYEVMTKEVEVNKPHDDIISVATSMLNDKHRRRPVVDGNKLIGQVTCRQILGAINEFTVPEK